MLKDAQHYYQQAMRRWRANPAEVKPAPATLGARWIVHFWPHIDIPAQLPPDDAIAKVDPVPVRINHGRWVVDCRCGGAQLACRTDHRMFCPDCLNMHADGRWIEVLWPVNADEIESLIEGRSIEMQNWTMDEDAAQLAMENRLLAVRDAAELRA